MATQNFNPAQFGAVPKKTFDPSQYGAVRVEEKKPSYLEQVKSGLEESAAERVGKIVEFSKRPGAGPVTGGLFAGGQLAALGGEALIAPFKPAISRATEIGGAIVPERFKQAFGEAVVEPIVRPIAFGAKKIEEAYQPFAEKFPKTARGIEAGLSLGEAALTAEGVLEAKALATPVIGAIKKAPITAAETISKLKTGIAARPSINERRALEALTVQPKGEKGIAKLFQRGAIKKGKVVPSSEVSRLSKEYADIFNTSNPEKQLSNLDGFMNSVEQGLDEAADSIGSLSFKDEVKIGLNQIKQEMPAGLREGALSRAYDRVLQYTSRLIDEAPETGAGLRDVKTKLDQSFKREFPNATTINPRTGIPEINPASPEGRAYLDTRDFLMKYLYEGRGGTLGTLSAQYSDLKKVGELLSQTAARKYGKGAFQLFSAKHPSLAKILKFGRRVALPAIGGAAAYEILQ